METIQKRELGEVETEEQSRSVSIEEVAVTGAEALQSVVGDIADSFDVRGFKCTECGLAHGHDTTKHRASDAFDMTEKEAAQMEYGSTCHCGYNEAAHKGIADVTPQEASRTAPIPDATKREMQSIF